MVCDRHATTAKATSTTPLWSGGPTTTKRFILQRINTDTFTDPVGLMENICGVTRHLRAAKILAEGGDPMAVRRLNVVPTLSGSILLPGR